MNSPQMSVDEAIQIANKAAQDASYNLSKFKKPSAHFEFDDKGQTWTIFYEGKIPKPGNHFQVWVNDITRESRVMPGE